MNTKEHIRILTEISAIESIEDLSEYYNDNYEIIRKNSYFEDYEVRLSELIQKEFNLNALQTGFIMGEAYSRYHSCYEEIFLGAKAMVKFCLEFNKLANKWK